MNISIKSRGNLRNQDYIYWLKCGLDGESYLDDSEVLNYLELVDERYPGILLFAQGGYYNLLVSGLNSVTRKEPSSPSQIRNFIFFTEIEKEQDARLLTIYALQNWHQLAKDVDAGILVDENPKSICGYQLNCEQLQAITQQILSFVPNLFTQTNFIRRGKLAYGGVQSQEWLQLSDELQRCKLPTKEGIYVLITNYLRSDLAERNIHPYWLLSGENQLSAIATSDEYSQASDSAGINYDLPLKILLATGVALICFLLKRN